MKKRFQFRLAHLLWLIVISALLIRFPHIGILLVGAKFSLWMCTWDDDPAGSQP
jgi:hypothetical protein